MRAFSQIALIGTLMLMGCMGASHDHADWVKPGASAQDFAKDSYECKRDKSQAGLQYGAWSVIKAEKMETECMHVKGWTER